MKRQLIVEVAIKLLTIEQRLSSKPQLVNEGPPHVPPLRGLQASRHRRGPPPPVFGLSRQPFSSRRSQRVILRAAIVVGGAPFGRQEPAQLQPVQRRIQRTLFHAKYVLRGLVNPFGDAVAVHRSLCEGFENQHIERALYSVPR